MVESSLRSAGWVESLVRFGTVETETAGWDESPAISGTGMAVDAGEVGGRELVVNCARQG